MPPQNCNSSLQLILNQIFARLESAGQTIDFAPLLVAMDTIDGNTEGLATIINGVQSGVNSTNQSLGIISTRTGSALSKLDALQAAVDALDSGGGGTVDLTAVMAALNDIMANTPTDLTTVLALLNDIAANTPTDLTALQSTANSHTTQLSNLQSTANSINSNTSGLTAQISPIAINMTNLQTTVNNQTIQISNLQAKIEALYSKQFPTPALELKFNANTYTDAAGTVAGGLNALIMGWKDTIGSPLFIQPVAGALRPTRVVDGMSFNGANILQVLTPAAINWAAGNFTLEWYANQATTSGTPISISINGSSYCGFVVMGHTIYLANAAGTGWAVSGLSLGALIANTWTHYAVVKEGGVLRTYRGGVQQATLAYTDTMYHLTTNYSYLGAQRSGLGYWNGKLTDFRIYNTCIYPGGQNFTPPTRST